MVGQAAPGGGEPAGTSGPGSPAAARACAPTARDLGPLFDPVSIVVVGASDDERKWGNWLARAALRGQRPVYLVNPGRDTVLGRPAYRSVTAVPGLVGLVAVCVPARQVAAAVDDALAAGARAIVAVSAGFGETDLAGRRLEQEIARRVRAAGSLLLGPNCLGVYDAGSGLFLTSNPLPAGRVAFLSQSGNLSLDLAGLLAGHGLGFSRFASLGNQADVGLSELVRDCAAHDRSDVIAIYCEQFTDGRAFVAAARDAGKPVVLLTAGSSAASARVAASHTGSMVAASAVVDAACAAAGVHRVHSVGELADLLALLAAPARPAGRRLAILTDGGGHAAIAAELACRSGLQVPVLSDRLRGLVSRHLPGHAGTSNPVDVAGGAEQDPHCLARVAEDLLDSGEVDALLLSGYFGGYAEYEAGLAAAELAVAARLGEAVRRTGRPLAVQMLIPDGPVAAALRASGIPVFRRAESATVGLGRLAPGASPPPERLAVPGTPATAAADGTDYWSARQLLLTAGVPFPAAQYVSSRPALEAAARRLRAPWVLKANSLLHKSDAGGVRLGLRDARELAASYDDLVARLAPAGCVLEESAEAAEGVELIAGLRRDPQFGLVVMVGVGGIYAELLADMQVALAPLAAGEVRTMLSRLRGAALLTGARGRPPLDAEAAAEVIALLAAIAYGHPEIAELEVNPLLVTAAGAVALDARIVTVR